MELCRSGCARQLVGTACPASCVVVQGGNESTSSTIFQSPQTGSNNTLRCDLRCQRSDYRSGRQNIAEGSRASATSSQTELRLVNVARSSLDELLLDFEDFLRHRRIPRWTADSPEALAVRHVFHRADQSDRSDQSDENRYALYAQWLDHDDPAIRANALICLIHQANYLLDRQIEALEVQFIEEGGYSEQLASARIAERNRVKGLRRDQSDRSATIPPCPKCGKPMVVRTAQKGQNAGRQFLGCTDYPECKGVVDI